MTLAFEDYVYHEIPILIIYYDEDYEEPEESSERRKERERERNQGCAEASLMKPVPRPSSPGLDRARLHTYYINIYPYI